MPPTSRRRDATPADAAAGARGHAVPAGLVTAVVGFTSAFAVVLDGLRAVGATPAQAASGLLAVTVAMGGATLVLALRTRMPVTVAWSTPGAALLAGTGAAAGGWGQAVGGFLLCGLLLALVGLVRPLEALVRRIPVPVAQAMLAGVLLPLCLRPVTATVDAPALVGPVVLVWLVVLRLAPRWATPAAIALAVAVAVVAEQRSGLGGATLLPAPVWTAPELGLPALVSVALPLFVVTMASQNIPGLAVLRGFGYTPPLRPVMLVTGVGTALAAPFGGHAVNLAAISAALAAGPEAGADRGRRWVAAVTAGLGYLVLGVGSAAAAAVALQAPAGLVAAAAGLALVPTFASSLAGAFGAEEGRTPAAAALLVTVSGISVAGVSAAFWGLLAGVVVHVALARRRG
ncbi:benzoate/H(+) symporter BenE family transporter [Cellulomonas marina]|uniref:Benzoate membrane transport protein n=1 Tax=Cellulomonas marina TaxID=988821 RepID=A0A1I0V9G3_9CELL|nr:benzoate/H(+) symporter BenE family transporter [Cellulomonas marina]GIG29203.1 benzoate transporter [Cellulomonas marina]SFA72971.1 benzoate membrane transport protein [Cellulomonas marina]